MNGENSGDSGRTYILWALSGIVLLLFALVWIWIGAKVLGFTPTDASPKVTFSEAQVTIAGFLAATVAAGTASVLGIEVQRVKDEPLQQGDTRSRSLAIHVSKAIAGSIFLKIGIGVYAIVGLFVLIVYFFESGAAPDMVGTFALGVLGWFAGAFAAAFQSQKTS